MPTNPDEQKDRKRKSNREWAKLERKRYPEKVKERHQRWLKAHPNYMAKYADRQKEYENTRKKTHPELPTRNRSKHLKRTYNLTLEQFDSMLAAQKGKCACCGTTTPGGKGGFHVDHDHTTHKIRGLLCNGCNCMLGFARDTIERLHQGAAYLLKHQ